MTTPTRFPFKQVGHAGPALESRVDELRGRLSLVPPTLLAERTGAFYIETGQSQGEFHLALLDAPVIFTYPDFQAFARTAKSPDFSQSRETLDSAESKASHDSLPVFKQALLVYYFLHSDGAPPAEKWISFADLPDGRIYSSAFQGYTGDLLARTFLLDLNAFRVACQKTEGVPITFGDAAYRFHALPHMDLLLVYHLGDEDFPSTCNLLFDANAGHYLPAEACAILGSSLTQKVLCASQKPVFFITPEAKRSGAENTGL